MVIIFNTGAVWIIIVPATHTAHNTHTQRAGRILRPRARHNGALDGHVPSLDRMGRRRHYDCVDLGVRIIVFFLDHSHIL